MKPLHGVELMRWDRGLTVSEVVRATGLAHATVTAAERGAPVSAKTAKKLADFYGVTVSTLLAEPQDQTA